MSRDSLRRGRRDDNRSPIPALEENTGAALRARDDDEFVEKALATLLAAYATVIQVGAWTSVSSGPSFGRR